MCACTFACVCVCFMYSMILHFNVFLSFFVSSFGMQHTVQDRKTQKPGHNEIKDREGADVGTRRGPREREREKVR